MAMQGPILEGGKNLNFANALAFINKMFLYSTVLNQINKVDMSYKASAAAAAAFQSIK